MNPTPVKAVFDCMVFLQGAGSRTGPARRCLELIEAGKVVLCISPEILLELADVLARPIILQKFPALTNEDAQTLLRTVRAKAALLASSPKSLVLPRDRDDEIYLDLAVAVKADYLVTWNDRHLTYLMREDAPEAKEFRERFSNLTILNPVQFLQAVAR